MKRHTILVTAALLALLGAALLGVRQVGRTRAQTRMETVQADFEWTYHLLLLDHQDDRLHEFLKARLYYLGTFLPSDVLGRYDKLNFGPVDESKLGNVLPAPPHADTLAEHFESTLNKSKMKTSEPEVPPYR